MPCPLPCRCPAFAAGSCSARLRIEYFSAAPPVPPYLPTYSSSSRITPSSHPFLSIVHSCCWRRRPSLQLWRR